MLPKTTALPSARAPATSRFWRSSAGNLLSSCQISSGSRGAAAARPSRAAPARKTIAQSSMKNFMARLLSGPIAGSVNRYMPQNLPRNKFFQLDPGQRLVGAFGDRRKRAIQRPGGVDDHRRSLARIGHGRIDQAAAQDLGNNRDLAVRLHPRRQRPENFRRIVDVDVVVENENVLGPIPGERRSRGAAGIAFGNFFHRDENIEQRVAPAR